MNALNNRIGKLEEKTFIPEEEPIFIHRVICKPSKFGPIEVEPLYREAKLHDGQLLRSEPSELLEDFQKRILGTDTEIRLNCSYRIIDVINLPGGQLVCK